MNKCALVIGAAGQDGSYLCELLVDKSYQVYAMVTSEAPERLSNLKNIIGSIKLYVGSVANISALREFVLSIKPDEIYYLATTHEKELNYSNLKNIFDVNVEGLVVILDLMKEKSVKSKLFYAASSNVYAGGLTQYQDEQTPFVPKSIYGIAKVNGIQLISLYREQYGVYACSGILYNHESPRRDALFLPRKISMAVARIKLSQQSFLRIGNLDAKRDWGAARDVVRAMWLMLQSTLPQDYLVGTGKLRTVKELLDCAFQAADLDWKKFVSTSSDYIRDEGIAQLVPRTSKLYDNLGWQPEIDFQELMVQMVNQDIKLFQSK